MLVVSERSFVLDYPIINLDRMEKGLNQNWFWPLQFNCPFRFPFINDGSNKNIKTEEKLTRKLSLAL